MGFLGRLLGRPQAQPTGRPHQGYTPSTGYPQQNGQQPDGRRTARTEDEQAVARYRAELRQPGYLERRVRSALVTAAEGSPGPTRVRRAAVPAAAHTGPMLDVALAQQLLSAGLLWEPAVGDRFVVPGSELGDLFHLSDMTIEVHEYPGGRVLGFNGTTEWALDSLELTDVLWLPREDQLRAALGDRFVSLTRTGPGWCVTTDEGEHSASDVEDAYGFAVLAMLGQTAPEPG